MQNLLFRSVYYYDLDIAAIANGLVLLFFFLVMKHWKVNFFRMAVFRLMVINSLFSAALDIVSAYFDLTSNCPPGSENIFIIGGWISNYLYLAVHNLQAPLYLIYIMVVAGFITTKNRKSSIFKILIPYLIEVAILTLGMVNGSTISYSIDEGYSHGSLFVLIYAISIGYVIAVFAALIRNGRLLLRRDLISITVLSVGVLIAVFLQIILGNVLVEVFVQSILLVFIIIAIEEQDVLYDPKTGCCNLQSFKEQAELKFKIRQKKDLIIVKTDGFEFFNKFRSVGEGELAKRMISGWIKDQTGSEYIFDCENDVFTVFVDPQTDEEVESFYKNTLERYRKWEYNDVIRLKMARIRIPEEADNLSALLIFLKSDFKEDKNRPHMVSEHEIAAIRRGSEVERAVMRGIKGDSVWTVFQPIMDKNGKLHAAEALSRMNDPALGSVPPFEFITAAENNGLIWQLGLNTIENSCKVLSELPENKRPEYIEINLSPVQCGHGGCLEAFMAILDRYKIKPSQINFEITESAMIQNMDAFIREKEDLAGVGFRFSIDDYGSGFSNYSYVKSVKPECVKLDRDALLDADADEKEALYYRDTVQMMRDMGYRIVAEGVETEDQLKFVRDAGVDFIQGYYYSKPVRADEFRKFCLNC
jgi:EAL domain-containing protein (putative c-di-GMP-specific phosphodiesterase class I)